MKYVRGNFWPGLEFEDLPDLNGQGWNWLDSVANVRVHGTTGEVPFVRLARETLQPLAGKPDYDTSLVCHRRSTKDCLVSYEGNHYSVPAAYAQQRLLVKETDGGELLIYTLAGRELARHAVLTGHRRQSIITDHYQGLPAGSSAPKRPGARQMIGRPGAIWGPFNAPRVEMRPLHQYDAWAEVAV